jgi:hypothetical protein
LCTFNKRWYIQVYSELFKSEVEKIYIGKVEKVLTYFLCEARHIISGEFVKILENLRYFRHFKHSVYWLSEVITSGSLEKKKYGNYEKYEHIF